MITGENLFIRRLEKNDLPNVLEWVNDPELFITMGIWGPRTENEQNDWYESISRSKTNIIFALCIKTSKEHIGNVSLFDIDNKNRNGGLTIFIGDKINQGKGFGSEAIELLCRYGFYYLNLHKIYCKTDNEIASKMYTRLGFKLEGTQREQVFRYGKYVKKLLYGLIKNEFQPTIKSNLLKL